MPSNIPTVGLRGRYDLKAPFSTDTGVLYTCVAVRRFVDIENQGRSVYDTYYAPFDIGTDTYQQDRRNDEVIVTLASDRHAPLYVPSSHISGYPGLDNINYQHVVLSLSLGVLPDTIDLTFAQQQVATAASAVVGVEPEVKVHVAPTDNAMTVEESEIAETNREAAIENRTTDYARLLEEQEKNAVLTQRLAVCEDILRQNGLIPE